MVERVDRRILGALRLLDVATGVAIPRRLNVTAPGITFYRNRSGHFVVMAATGLSAHISVFEAPPVAPPADSLPFVVSITDPARLYLPRTASITLPRPFDPAADVRDLQDLMDIELAPAANSPAAPGWAVAQTHVQDTANAPIRGALIEIFPQAGGARMAWGITNDHGEAVVPVPGLSPFREVENDPADPDDNDIVTNETGVQIRATVDPTLPWPADPERLAAGSPTFRTTTLPVLTLVPGRADSATLTVDLS